MGRGDLSKEQWERLKPMLPTQKPKTGRPAHAHQAVINGILWVLRTGAPWRDLPERYGKWQTIASRYYRWCKAGIWDQLLAELQRQADADGELNWEVHYVDGTTVRAHQHAAGAKGGTPRPKRWAVVEADSARRSTCEQKGMVNR